jgi:hypothetical protein
MRHRGPFGSQGLLVPPRGAGDVSRHKVCARLFQSALQGITRDHSGGKISGKPLPPNDLCSNPPTGPQGLLQGICAAPRVVHKRSAPGIRTRRPQRHCTRASKSAREDLITLTRPLPECTPRQQRTIAPGAMSSQGITQPNCQRATATTPPPPEAISAQQKTPHAGWPSER